MKNSILLFACLFLFSFSCIKFTASSGKDGEDAFNFSVNSSDVPGPIKEKTIKGAFSGLRVSGGLKAEVYKSAENKVVISAPEEVIDFVEAVVQQDGTVNIEVVKKSSLFSNISTKSVLVKVYLKNLEKVEASASASVHIKDAFIEEEISLKATSSAEINGNLEANFFTASVSSSATVEAKIWADKAEISASSSGTMKLKGKIQNADIAASSSGSIYGEEVEVKRGSLKTSSSGTIITGLSGSASATATSSGTIAIKKIGNPEISKTTSSSGSVKVY